MRELALTVLLLIAAVCDGKERRIPNALIWTGWTYGFCYRLVTEGAVGLLQGIATVGLVIAVGLPMYCFRAIGAGDVKLLSVIGGAHGISFLCQVSVVWLILSGIVSAGVLVRRRLFLGRFRYLWFYFTAGGNSGTAYYDRERDGTECTIILAPMLAVAYVLVLAGRWRGIC